MVGGGGDGHIESYRIKKAMSTAVGETSFKTPFLSEGYGSPFFMTWAPLDSAPPKIT
jgi:hypothetical protein